MSKRKPKKRTKSKSKQQNIPAKTRKSESPEMIQKSDQLYNQNFVQRLQDAWKILSNLFTRSRISKAGTDAIMGNDSNSIIDSEPTEATDRQDDNQESPTMITSRETLTSGSLTDVFQNESARPPEIQPIQQEITPAILVTEFHVPTPSEEPVISSSTTLAGSVEGESISPETSSPNESQAELQTSSEHLPTRPEAEEYPNESLTSDLATMPTQIPDVLSTPDPALDDLPPHLSLNTGEGSRFKFRIFRMEGSSSHAYQDAAEADPETGFVAIADGTTLGGYSDIVSNELVKRFVQNQCDLDDDNVRAAWWLGTRKVWYAQLRTRYNDASSTEQARWDRGGSATFMGLRICDDGTYNLHNVGDCSLLWFNETLTNLIHIDGATTFNSHPCVLHTDQDNPPNDLLENRISGRKIPSSTALLVTDALSKLFQETKRWEVSNHFGNMIRYLDESLLYKWFSSERDDSNLEPDDFTFILLDFSNTRFNDLKDSQV